MTKVVNFSKERMLPDSKGTRNPQRLMVTDFKQGKEYVPGIRVAGKYLQNLGFTYHDEVIISFEYGRIEINKVEKGVRYGC